MNAKDVESEIPHWDLGRDVAQTVKSQIDLLLNYIIKSVKNKEERRNRYLLPLKYLLCYVENSRLQDILKMDADQEAEFALLLRKQMGESNVNATKFIAFCRKTLFLEAKEINWEANVWYVEKLNISPERYSLSSTIESFSFLDIRLEDNRKMFQEYMKYFFTITKLNLGTIRIKQTYIKAFLKYLEKQEKAITTIDANSVKEYFEKLSIQRISPQSYNNKIQAITAFLQYLQMKDKSFHNTCFLL